jgi:fatty acid/phospholipid biosynthesis enzyme
VTHGVEPALQAVFDTFDAREKGAAQLLGTRGVALISHGSSSSATVANAIATADELVDIGIVEELRAALAERASW